METLGTKLKSAREKMNISLEKASEITQIRTHILDAFEKGNFNILPAVYAKSFVINYAKMLKIDISEIKDELDEIFPDYKKQVPQKTEDVTKHKKRSKKYWEFNSDNRTKIVSLIIYFVIFIAIILIIYLTFIDKETVLLEENEANNETVGDTAIVKDEEENLFSFYSKSDSLILEAIASDSAWMKIIIDGKKSEQVYFYPNLSKRWSAANDFILSLGNAGAIKLIRNGVELPPLGPVGTVVRNVKITETEVINSSKPWSPSKSKQKVNKEEKQVPKLEPIQIKEDEKKLLKKLKEFKKPEPLIKPNNNKIQPFTPNEKKEEKTPPN